MCVNRLMLMRRLQIMTATTLMLTVVNCQPLKPARVVRGLHQTDTAVRLALEQDVSRHRRRLAAYHVMTQNVDDDDDGRWLLVAGVAAAAVVTSLMTTLALCSCCPPYGKRRRRADQSYIGQIDLEDIRVICNRAVTSPGGAWSGSPDSGVVVNVRALDQPHQKQPPPADCTILNNQRLAAVKQCSDSKTAAASVADGADGGDVASDAGMSEVLVENGRIVLQYRNIYAGVRPAEHNTASRLHDADTLDRTGPGHAGHVISAPAKPQADLEYDMNDVVWKNMAASSNKY